MSSANSLQWVRCPACEKDHLVMFGPNGFSEYGAGEVHEDEDGRAYLFTYEEGGVTIMMIGPNAETVQKIVTSMAAHGLIRPLGGVGEAPEATTQARHQ